ncbi:MAG: bifunctional diaminohydroxyphosphoribosylaminopyrimidine deaminase/5-amino-6-(5-phosphoribosylamino)uracil reductase RibD [Pseudohongiellaceae bacterium]
MKTLENLQKDKSVLEWPVYMRRAIDLAGIVLSATPNPRVGCVIINAGEIVSEGWHAAAGLAHAEVMAIEKAGELAQGGIAFVSLEPCSFTGRTGPCSQALIEAGLSTVVIAGLDPDARVSGSGVKQLEDAGIEVFHLPEFEPQAQDLNRGYFKRHTAGLPFVRLKLAMSLDGRTALASGESKWITSSAARSDVQRIRASSSVILTGVNTVIDDDPTLNVRTEDLSLDEEELNLNQDCLAQQPMRVILDSQLKTPGTARILAATGQVKIFTTSSGSHPNNLADNVEIVQVAREEKGVDLESVLASLASKFACNDVLIEAGPTLSGSFIEKNLVDELIVYVAPKILGSDAKPLLEISGLSSLAEATQLEIKEVTEIGKDIKATLSKPN